MMKAEDFWYSIWLMEHPEAETEEDDLLGDPNDLLGGPNHPDIKVMNVVAGSDYGFHGSHKTFVKKGG